MTHKRLRMLIEAAKRARRRAYCPYSRYPIGAAVLTESGRIFAGANIENASYGLAICAERVAVFNAVSRGEKGFRAVCVVGRSPKPCGACRQVMLEFSSKETELITVDLLPYSRREAVTRTRVVKTLPNAFDPLDAGLLPTSPQNLLTRRRGRAPSKRSRRTGAKRARKRKGGKR